MSGDDIKRELLLNKLDEVIGLVRNSNLDDIRKIGIIESLKTIERIV